LYNFLLWPTNAQLFHKLSHCYMFLSIKPVWNSWTVNCITDSCIWNTGVTGQGVDCRLSEGDRIVSKHVAVW